jgi:hypothetical protein
MMKKMKQHLMMASAGIFIGLVSGVESASAGNNFGTIVQNMEDSITRIPGLISGVSYMMGILLGVLGVLKIKDHVENPGNTPLQHGAIRLAAGGGLFALPIVYEAMRNTIGDDQNLVSAPAVKAMTLDVQ